MINTKFNFSIDKIASDAFKLNASDFHIIPGQIPAARYDGSIESIYGYDVTTASDINDICGSLLNDKDMRKLQEDGSIDKGYQVNNDFRLRVSISKCLEGHKVVCRIVPSKIPTLEEYKMPIVFSHISDSHTGLVIIGGVTGSGKSTTIAAMIEHINKKKKSHVVTIEDPIEFVHKPNQCIFTRREVNTHVKSFSDGLRTALRQDPDVILVGEMRDLETMRAAMRSAETGHLVFSTVHAGEVDDIPERIIGCFPDYEQNQIRNQITNVSLAFIAQSLMKRKDGKGRVAAYEILILNNAARNLIREEKSNHLSTIMQTGRKSGMITMTEYLMALHREKVIDDKTLIAYSTNKERARNYILATSKIDVAQPWSFDINS